jgi:hypothetical protein
VIAIGESWACPQQNREHSDHENIQHADHLS